MMTLDKLMGLDKHTARATAGVINHATVRFYHFRNQLNNASRRVKFTIFLCPRSGIHLQEILVYTTDQIFFMETRLINFIHFVDKLLDPQIAEILGMSVDELMQVKHGPENREPRQSVRDIVSLSLRAVCLAMDVAVVALSIFGQISTQSAVVMLGIGLGCAGISLLENSKK